MRRILTSQYWVFSPNWICHSNTPSHTITSLRPTPAGPDTATQSRYMWMVGISVTVCVCVWLCACVWLGVCVCVCVLVCVRDSTWLPLPSIFFFLWIQSIMLFVLVFICISPGIRFQMLLETHHELQNKTAWLLESWAVLCCCGLLLCLIYTHSL